MSRKNQEKLISKLFKTSTIGIAMATISSMPAVADSHSQRAETNRDIMSCYAVAASIAYEDSNDLHRICTNGVEYGSIMTPADEGRDNRLGMGDWVPAYNQPSQYGDVLKIFERNNANNRKEILFAFRGSASVGDWLQDSRAQIFLAHNLTSTAIGSITPPAGSNNPKANAGFFARLQNLSPEIDARLDALEAWRNQDSLRRTVGIKIAGHSLGAAVGTLASYYIANRYLNNIKFDVEAFNFGSPIVSNSAFARDINKRASTCNYNVHFFSNSKDIVPKIPRPGQALELLPESRNPGSQFAIDECRYVKGVRVRNDVPWWYSPVTKVLKYHEVSQWFNNHDSEGFNSQSSISDDQIVAMFPESPIGSQSILWESWDPNFNSLNSANIETVDDTVTSSEVQSAQSAMRYLGHDTARWQHAAFLGFSEQTNSRSANINGYRLTMQSDGNFVLYHSNNPIWATGTNGSGRRIAMQADGNLVIYQNNTPLWASNTVGSNAENVVLTYDGVIALLDENGNIVATLNGPSGYDGIPN